MLLPNTTDCRLAADLRGGIEDEREVPAANAADVHEQRQRRVSQERLPDGDPTQSSHLDQVANETQRQSGRRRHDRRRAGRRRAVSGVPRRRRSRSRPSYQQPAHAAHVLGVVQLGDESALERVRQVRHSASEAWCALAVDGAAIVQRRHGRQGQLWRRIKQPSRRVQMYRPQFPWLFYCTRLL